MMVEIIVPEPAAFYKYSQSRSYVSISNVIKPEPPVVEWSAGVGMIATIMSSQLEPQLLTKTNYLDFIAQYNVQDVEPYPDEIIRLSCAGSGETTGDDAYLGTIIEKLNIPNLYECDKIWGEMACQGLITTETDNEGDIHVREQGKLITTFISGRSFNQSILELYPRSGILPISISGYLYTYNVNIVASCKITQKGIQSWQLKTYQAIMNAYENALAKYNESVSLSQILNGPNILGKNPDINRRIEQDELKRAALKIITNDYHITQVAGVDDAGIAIPNSYHTYTDEKFDAMNDGPDGPYIDIPEAIKEGPVMQFFEQAFEWDNMTYRFYPYFYGREKNWGEAINTIDGDPLFSEFLKAGAARVLVPVRPAYQEAVLLYLATNIIWNGGSVPAVDSDLYVSFAQELKEQTDADYENLPVCNANSSNYPCKEGEAWVIKVPTSLVYLQDDGDLNP